MSRMHGRSGGINRQPFVKVGALAKITHPLCSGLIHRGGETTEFLPSALQILHLHFLESALLLCPAGKIICTSALALLGAQILHFCTFGICTFVWSPRKLFLHFECKCRKYFCTSALLQSAENAKVQIFCAFPPLTNCGRVVFGDCDRAEKGPPIQCSLCTSTTRL